MYTVKLLPEAEAEVKEACKWYETKQVGLAAKFLKELDYYLQQISNNPMQYQVRFSEIYRFVTLKVFPYFIVFRINIELSEVYVISVFHTSRKPDIF